MVKMGSMEVGRVPLEDIGLLILDAIDTTYTHHVLIQALQAGAVIVPCGQDHLPVGLYLPQNNTLQTQRIIAQTSALLPLKKRLWKQLIQAKVRHQARVLGVDTVAGGMLVNLAKEVRSGDPTNIEAQAARKYWPVLLGPSFRRNRDGDPPNNLLNYGYMAMRACVARAICGAGLHPSLGLHHHNRGNPFCLADDLLEPLRPIVDREVRQLVGQGQKHICRDTKVRLLSLLTVEIEVAAIRGPLMVAIERMTASLVRCYAGEQKSLELPDLCS